MKFSYDVSDQDAAASASGGGEQAPVAMYLAKVTECKVTKPEGKDKRIEVIYAIQNISGYAPLYDYINLESEGNKWKVDQFLLAMGHTDGKTKRKGSADTDNFVGNEVKLRVKADSYGGEYKAKVGGVWALDGDEEWDGAEDSGDAEEFAEEGDEEATEAPEDDERWTEFLGMAEDAILEDEDVQAEITAYGTEVDIDVDDYELWTEAIEAINDARNAGDETEAEDSGGEEEEAEEDADYSALSIPELKAELEARDLDVPKTKAKMITALEENDAETFDE